MDCPRGRLTRTQRQIEEHRKGTAVIQVRDPHGRARGGAPVSVEQEAHEFPFACVIGDLSAFSDHDRDRHQLRLREVFNRVYRATQRRFLPPNVVEIDATKRVHLGALRTTLDQLAREGKELDVYLSGQSVERAVQPAQPTTGGLSERDFGYRVVDLYTLAFSHPSVRQIVWNGCSDREADVAGGGLLRGDLSPKHAHKLLRKLVGATWHTRAVGETDSCGSFQFRGFFGTYRVVVTLEQSKARVTTLSLARGDDGSRPLIIEST